MSSEHKTVGSSPPKLSKEQVDALLNAPPGEFLATVYVDALSTQPKTDKSREQFRQLLQSEFELKLPDAVERFWDLPQLILQRPNDEYVNLLVEARKLYTMGYFYSCVAMCGIVGEKLIKDLLRGSVTVSTDGVVRRPGEDAFDQLEHVEVGGLTRFLNKANLLSDDATRATEALHRLRNQYAHARGKNPQSDALVAIGKLHILVEGTVSVLKDFEIVDGIFVPRTVKLTSAVDLATDAASKP